MALRDVEVSADLDIEERWRKWLILSYSSVTETGRMRDTRFRI
jgi:hypothetical protein